MTTTPPTRILVAPEELEAAAHLDEFAAGALADIAAGSSERAAIRAALANAYALGVAALENRLYPELREHGLDLEVALTREPGMKAADFEPARGS
jgi:hypothetical protein